MENLTAEFLSTTGGGALAATLITQALKNLKWFENTDPKWISMFVGMVVSVITRLTIHPVTPENIFVAITNGLIAFGASVGTFETSKSVKRAVTENTNKEGE